MASDKQTIEKLNARIKRLEKNYKNTLNELLNNTNYNKIKNINIRITSCYNELEYFTMCLISEISQTHEFKEIRDMKDYYMYNIKKYEHIYNELKDTNVISQYRCYVRNYNSSIDTITYIMEKFGVINYEQYNAYEYYDDIYI